MAKRKRRAAKRGPLRKKRTAPKRRTTPKRRSAQKRRTVTRHRTGAKRRTAAKRRSVTKRRAPAKRRTAAKKARITRIPVARDKRSVEEFNDHPLGGEDTLATDDTPVVRPGRSPSAALIRNTRALRPQGGAIPLMTLHRPNSAG